MTLACPLHVQAAMHTNICSSLFVLQCCIDGIFFLWTLLLHSLYGCEVRCTRILQLLNMCFCNTTWRRSFFCGQQQSLLDCGLRTARDHSPLNVAHDVSGLHGCSPEICYPTTTGIILVLYLATPRLGKQVLQLRLPDEVVRSKCAWPKVLES